MTLVGVNNDDAKVDAMEQADAGAATTLAGLFESDLFPDAADDEEEGRDERGASNL